MRSPGSRCPSSSSRSTSRPSTSRWSSCARTNRTRSFPACWTLAFNPGAAFSFLAGENGWQRWLFTVLAIGVSALLAGWLSRLPRSDWRNALPLSLIIGGALGNLIDRLRFGHVTDFVQVYWREWSFPASTVADSAISVGAVLLVVFGLFASGKAAVKGG